MAKYGDAAVLATFLYREGRATSPREAWDAAVSKVFPSSESSRSKGCPRGAFLGLCESGAITGIPSGSYCRSEKNKNYALKAQELIRKHPYLLENEQALWLRVMDGEQKVHNHQMDVVISLWNAGLGPLNA